jgi:hypothetical protein
MERSVTVRSSFGIVPPERVNFTLSDAVDLEHPTDRADINRRQFIHFFM